MKNKRRDTAQKCDATQKCACHTRGKSKKNNLARRRKCGHRRHFQETGKRGTIP